MTAIILICSVALGFHCADNTATDILRPHGVFTNPIQCLAIAQEFLAQSGVKVPEDHFAIIQCRTATRS